jgi:large subunit ribosomal protein L15
VPKRGFNNRWGLTVVVVNVGDLEQRFAAGAEVTPDALRAVNLAKGRYDVLKVLGNGRLTKRLTISAHRFSRSAVEKIERAGGRTIVLPGKRPVTTDQ